MPEQTTPKFCRSCGAAASPGRFCSECGASLAEPPGSGLAHAPDQSANPEPDDATKLVTNAEPPAQPTSSLPSWALLAGLAAVLVLGIAIAVFVSTRGGSNPTVEGSLTLVGGGGYTESTPCQGTSNSLIDNSDMGPDTPIKILDASGTIIGGGTLGPGEYKAVGGISGGSQCRFTFVIPLDAASTRYQIVIAERTPYDFTDPTSLELTLGGPPR